MEFLFCVDKRGKVRQGLGNRDWGLVRSKITLSGALRLVPFVKGDKKSSRGFGVARNNVEVL